MAKVVLNCDAIFDNYPDKKLILSIFRHVLWIVWSKN